MNVLMIAPTPFFADRGCHVRIYEEILALQRLGHKVTLVTYHIGRDVPGVTIRRVPPLLFWYKRLGAGPSWSKIVLDALLFGQALWLSYRQPFDVIHAHLHEGCVIGYLCSRLRFRRLPLLFDLQGGLVSELLAHKFIRPGGVIHRMMLRAEKTIVHLPDVTITSSETSASEQVNRFGMAASDIHIVYDGVDAGAFCPRPRPAALQASLGIPDKARIVIYLGVLAQYQGVDLLIQAVQNVRRRVPDVHFLLIGYPNEVHYREMVAELGISESVTVMGKLDYAKAPEWLCLGDIAVSPKLPTSESNGKLLNYMACGLPVVAFDTITNRRILGEHAVYPTDISAEALAAAIIRLLEDDQLAARLATEGRERAALMFSWTSIARRITELYEAISTTERLSKESICAQDEGRCQ